MMQLIAGSGAGHYSEAGDIWLPRSITPGGFGSASKQSQLICTVAFIFPVLNMASLTALAEEALKQAKLLDAYAAAQGRPPTSFDLDTLTHLPPHLAESREALVNSTHTLKRLALGPVGVLTEIMWAVRPSASKYLFEHCLRFRSDSPLLVFRRSVSGRYQ